MQECVLAEKRYEIENKIVFFLHIYGQKSVSKMMMPYCLVSAETRERRRMNSLIEKQGCQAENKSQSF